MAVATTIDFKTWLIIISLLVQWELLVENIPPTNEGIESFSMVLIENISTD